MNPVEEIDPANTQMVGADGAGNVYVQVPKTRMTRAEALAHAAWLVLVAGGEDDFGAALDAVRASRPARIAGRRRPGGISLTGSTGVQIGVSGSVQHNNFG